MVGGDEWVEILMEWAIEKEELYIRESWSGLIPDLFTSTKFDIHILHIAATTYLDPTVHRRSHYGSHRVGPMYINRGGVHPIISHDAQPTQSSPNPHLCSANYYPDISLVEDLRDGIEPCLFFGKKSVLVIEKLGKHGNISNCENMATWQHV